MITIAEAQRYYKGADAVHDFDHVLRVLSLARRIGQAEGADPEIVHAAALLHDIGRERAEATGRDHAEFAAERARDILAGAPPEKVEAVAHAVATHRFRTGPEPTTLEAQVLFDADKLDAIGAVGVARAFAYGGAHGQQLWAPRETVDLDRWIREGDDADIDPASADIDPASVDIDPASVDIDPASVDVDPASANEHTPVHEFVVKLSRIRERLYTPTGRSIAEGRHAYMVAFFERLDAEVRGKQ